MTTQDTGLVEVMAKALLVRDNPVAQWYAHGSTATYHGAARAVLTAILPHLSPESQALLRKELNGE